MSFSPGCCLVKFQPWNHGVYQASFLKLCTFCLIFSFLGFWRIVNSLFSRLPWPDSASIFLYVLHSDQGESLLPLTFFLFLHQNSLPNCFSAFAHSLWSTSFPTQKFKSSHWHRTLHLRWLSSLLIKGIISLMFLTMWFLILPCETTQKILPCPQPPSCPASFRPLAQAVVYIRGDNAFSLSFLPAFKSCVADGFSCHP